MTSGVRPRVSRSGAAIPTGPPASNSSAIADASAVRTAGARNFRFIRRNLPFVLRRSVYLHEQCAALPCRAPLDVCVAGRVIAAA